MKRNSAKLLSSITGYFRLLLVATLIACLLGTVVHCMDHMRKNTAIRLNDISARVEERVLTTIALLESLREDEIIGDTTLPLQERVQKLKNYSERFGYAIMGITDEDINVYSTNDKSGNLARRDFMQELYATGEMQVTDVYAAGENGSLLIYTIAVPIYRDGRVVGSIWASLGKDELDSIIKERASDYAQMDLIIFGSNANVLASSEVGTYDMRLFELSHESIFITDKLEHITEELRQGVKDSYFSLKAGVLSYAAYQGIPHTNWSVMCRGGIFGMLWESMISFIPMFALLLVGGIFIERKLQKRLSHDFSTMEQTMQSIEAMNQKIAGGEDGMDTQNILDITSRGLIDALTGTVTRTVFASVIEGRLAAANPKKASVLCFVDLDNLKTLNDNYGHEWGDDALAHIGHTLRKYEKTFDGLATRYGGDEFIIFLPNLKNRDEVERVLQSIVRETHFELKDERGSFMVHCSIGAALLDSQDTVTELIAKADKALYKAKRHGKNTYSICDETKE